MAHPIDRQARRSRSWKGRSVLYRSSGCGTPLRTRVHSPNTRNGAASCDRVSSFDQARVLSLASGGGGALGRRDSARLFPGPSPALLRRERDCRVDPCNPPRTRPELHLHKMNALGSIAAGAPGMRRGRSFAVTSRGVRAARLVLRPAARRGVDVGEISVYYRPETGLLWTHTSP